MKTNNIDPIDMNSLISGLRAEDTRNVRISKVLQWVYFIFVPFYLIVFNIPMGEEITLKERIGGLCYALAFLIFALIFRNMHKEYNSVDYALPTIDVMKQAVKRYTFWKPKLIWVILPIVLIDLGLFFTDFNNPDKTNSIHEILTFHITFISAILIGFIAGVIIWYKRQKPLKDNAQQIIDEIEG